MFKLLILLSFLVSFNTMLLRNSFALDVEEVETPKKYLVIDPFDSKLVSDFEMNQINKIMLQVATKQSIFHLLLTSDQTVEGTKAQVISMKLELIRNGDVYEIEGSLFDLKKESKIKVKKESNILRKDLQRKIYLLLESLFLDEEVKKKQVK